jgi:hypothetical protein
MRLAILAATLFLAPSLAMAQSATAQSPSPNAPGAAVSVPPSDKTVNESDRSKVDPAKDRSGGTPSDQSALSGSSQTTSTPTPGIREGTTVVSPPVTSDGKPAGTPVTGKP